jgi:NADPH:quinone reductase-like Zn-dependent oxidoreductase
MRVWRCRRYGGPERLERISLPTPQPRAGEVLVKIHATTVSSGDVRVRALRLPRGFGPFGRLALGLLGPRQPVLGTEFSGTIAAVGPGVTAWRHGDAVIGFPGIAMGGHAEYRIMPPGRPLVAKPAALGFETASALCFGGTTALDFLRRAGVRRGESLLVVGAAGAVGSAMVQLGRHLGARITAVVSPPNIALARELGADTVIDRSLGDFFRHPESYDVIADVVGATTFARAAPRLREHGRYLAVNADLAGMFARRIGTKRSIAGPAPESPADVECLARFAAEGVFRPVIGRVFAFDELPSAHALVDTGRKHGSVVVRVAG